MAPRRKALRWVLSLLAVAALAALWIGSLFLRARQTLQEHLREVRSSQEVVSSALSERPAIFDPSEPGNAWELERRALEGINDTPPATGEAPSRHRSVVSSGTLFLLEETLTRRVQETAPSIALLRSALRRRVAVPDRRPGWITNRQTDEALDILRHAAILRHDQQEDLAAFEHLVLSIALAQDVARHGDREHRSTLWKAETRAALVAKGILEAHSLSSRDLETVARWLDRVASARPPLAVTIARDAVIDRSIIVDPEFVTAVYTSAVDPPLEPTWRELWSSTLLAAKRSSAIAQAARRYEQVDALPSWERVEEARRVPDSLDPRLCRPGETPDEAMFQSDVRGLTALTLLRIAVAVAWYQMEHDAFPAALDALVPRYLPSVPRCPRTGTAIHLDRGRVWFDLPPESFVEEGDDTAPWDKTVDTMTADWRIGRKPK